MTWIPRSAFDVGSKLVRISYQVGRTAGRVERLKIELGKQLVDDLLGYVAGAAWLLGVACGLYVSHWVGWS